MKMESLEEAFKQQRKYFCIEHEYGKNTTMLYKGALSFYTGTTSQGLILCISLSFPREGYL